MWCAEYYERYGHYPRIEDQRTKCRRQSRESSILACNRRPRINICGRTMEIIRPCRGFPPIRNNVEDFHQSKNNVEDFQQSENNVEDFQQSVNNVEHFHQSEIMKRISTNQKIM